ncbi:SDR family NAD(P)-dependent oxidoreductase [Streptomyces sp. LX-29]|uniref:type I polyketide synthase n=1 Tax=Streptomyces sp. LX-29 TaxID=2900152 RepID=UPI00240D204D|nr:type I polyketide synthase [Streptomyces sp. LX-29]WFB10770.1 SDR family NAD(P)-dependent oxidoreductase [Streptomyces sp. LX-29]
MRTVDGIADWLRQEVEKEVGTAVRDADMDTQFRDLGMDSEGMTALTARLAAHLGISLAPTVAWHFPTIAGLSGALADGGPEAEPSASSPGLGAAAPADEPIAVIGMACRFPGAPDVEAYWDLLRSGTDAVTDVPAERWDSAALYDPDPAAPGKLSTRRGGFLTDVDQFDPRFFGISPREAAQMDPQQRLSLELAWSSLQDAGVRPSSLKDSGTGVFLGTLWSDYARLAGRGLDAIEQHTATGQEPSIVPARVSYTLGLQGPSIGVNTACSSSLVALHLACQSLRSGESTLALAGGVNLVLAPEGSAAMSKLGAMSPNGRSAAFAASADGYVRGEGGGVVVLKRLSAALADGDRIHCLIRGSAVNNDGPSNGLTAPNPAAQEAMLRAAYARSGVDAHDVQYVEAHGTGTRLGDPIEAHALGTVLGAGRPADAPLLVGSVKTNIGHLEAAAGIAGLIKVVLSMRHRVLPATLHHTAPNPDIAFADLRLAVPAEPTDWPARGDRLLAGVSSFGFGGTNCHVVVEGPPTSPAQPLALSGPTPEDLRTAAGALLDAVTDTPTHSVADWCASAALNLSGHPHRVVATVRTRDELVGALRDIAGGVTPPTTTAPSRLAFVFSGQGSQWCGMGLDLLHGEPAFRAALEECAALIDAQSGISVVEELRRGAADSRLDDTAVLQPAVFAVQIALAALWRSWGVEPDAVVGHSLGEVAAAHVAGALSLEDAVRVVCERSRLMSRIEGDGAVAVVDVPFADVPRLLADHPGVDAAGANSPTTSVLSGDIDALDALLADLNARGVRCRRVNMGVASHSAQCDPLLPELRAALSGIRTTTASLPMVSSVTADVVDGAELDADYWADNLRRPVLFAPAVQLLLDQGYDHFLEVSPHAVLTGPVTAVAADRGARVQVLASQRRDESARETLLSALGELYRSGRDLAWRKILPADLNPAELPPAAEKFADPAVPAHGVRVLPLSAHSAPALRQLARDTRGLVEGTGRVDLDDLSHTAAHGRDQHEHRAAAVFTTAGELADLLEAYEAGRAAEGLMTGKARRTTSGPVFLFSGQGAQAARMGCELLAHEPAFRDVLERCDRWLTAQAGWSLIAELHAPEDSSRIDETEITQPALFALQAGLAELLRSWGVRPAAVIGHSAGEIAAAYCAGALTLEDALLVALHRGRTLQKATGTGRMAAVGLAAPDVAKLLETGSGEVSIAAVNGPRTTLVSGETQALRALLDSLAPAVFRRELRVGYPSHSSRMRAYEQELGRLLADVRPRACDIPVFSTIDAEFRPGTHFDAAYWVRTISEPVRFAPAVEALAAAGHRTFVELGPHPVLVAPAAQSLEHTGHEGVVVPTMRRETGERRALREAVGTLWAQGHPIDWKAVRPAAGRLVTTPEYPWQRERHWITPAPLTATEPATGTLLDLLARGEVDRVADEMARRGGLSNAERELLPAILRRLAAGDEDAYPWLHHLGWHERPLTGTAGTADPHAWIVLTDDPEGPLTRSVSQALRTAGQRCTVLPVPAEPETHLPDALRQAVRASGPACRGVLHLVGDAPDATLEEHLERSLRPALATVRALASWEDGRAPRVWLVTSGAQPVGERPVEGSAGQGALWGLGRVVALEHPEVWGGLVDLDPAPGDTAGTALVAELLAGDGEDQVAFRAGRRHVARVTAAEKEPGTTGPVTMRADGGYLITGGLGGIGLVAARWMVDAGARHVVLVGRRSPGAEARATLAELRSAGARVDVVHADVTRADEVRDLVASFGRERPPLRGVFHAAGVLDDGTLLQQDWDRYRAVLAPKVHGAHHLDVCTRELPLDFFVLFSSFVAVLGSPGQGNYAAANAALDTLAHHRRALGLPATSVNWGPWQGVGMTDSTAAAAYRWSERGARTIDRAQGAPLLDRILARDTPQLGVYSVDWATYRSWLPATANSDLLALVHGPDGAVTEDAAPDAEDTAAALSLPDRLAATEPGDRLEQLIAHLSALVADIAGFSADHTVDPDTGFFQLGLDSLMKLKLVTRLREDLGDRLTIPGTLPFDHPTCAALAAHLLDELALTPGAHEADAEPPRDANGAPTAHDADAADTSDPADPADPDDMAALLAEVESLSADEAARYLDQLTLGNEPGGDTTHD